MISIEKIAERNTRLVQSDREEQTRAVQLIVEDYLNNGRMTKDEAWKFTRQPIIVGNNRIKAIGTALASGYISDIVKRDAEVFKREFKERANG